MGPLARRPDKENRPGKEESPPEPAHPMIRGRAEARPTTRAAGRQEAIPAGEAGDELPYFRGPDWLLLLEDAHVHRAVGRDVGPKHAGGREGHGHVALRVEHDEAADAP